MSRRQNGAALTEVRTAPLMWWLVGAVVGGGTAAAGAFRTTAEALLLGVGDSACDQFTGNTVGQLRQRRSSGGFFGWCEWWCRRLRSSSAAGLADSSKGSVDSRGNVGELRLIGSRDILSIAPSFSVI
jgi:hypothetical protein